MHAVTEPLAKSQASPKDSRCGFAMQSAVTRHPRSRVPAEVPIGHEKRRGSCYDPGALCAVLEGSWRLCRENLLVLDFFEPAPDRGS